MTGRNTFEKSCGSLTIRVSEPSPRWITVEYDGASHSDLQELTGLTVSDLHDLEYLVKRALMFIAANPE